MRSPFSVCIVLEKYLDTIYSLRRPSLSSSVASSERALLCSFSTDGGCDRFHSYFWFLLS